VALLGAANRAAGAAVNVRLTVPPACTGRFIKESDALSARGCDGLPEVDKSCLEAQSRESKLCISAFSFQPSAFS
jgi:hypothetical protein